eukprot:5233331-Heterocapsa_arctica.AAC.1
MPIGSTSRSSSPWRPSLPPTLARPGPDRSARENRSLGGKLTETPGLRAHERAAGPSTRR